MATCTLLLIGINHWGRVLFMQKLAVSLIRRTIERLLGGWIQGVPSRFWAEGEAWGARKEGNFTYDV